MPSEDKPFVCEYCGKGYTREKTLLAHMCEKKRRHLQKDEKRVRFGHYAFQRFYKLSAGAKKEKHMKTFVTPVLQCFKFGSI